MLAHFRKISDESTGTSAVVRLMFGHVAYKKLKAPPNQGWLDQGASESIQKTLAFAFNDVARLSADIVNVALGRVCEGTVRTSAVVRMIVELLGRRDAEATALAQCIESDFWRTDKSLIHLGRVPTMLRSEGRHEDFLHNLLNFASVFPEFLEMPQSVKEAFDAPSEGCVEVGLSLVASLVEQTEFFEGKLVVPSGWTPSHVAAIAWELYQLDQAQFRCMREHRKKYGRLGM